MLIRSLFWRLLNKLIKCIVFKLPYVNYKLIYKDNTDKSKGYILKDGSYSKKLRVSSLKKVELMDDKWLYHNIFYEEFL